MRTNRIAKRVSAIALCAALAVGSLAVSAGAAQSSTVSAQLSPDISVEVDGAVRTFYNVNGQEVHPIAYNGTTYLPVRAIGELMGKNVNWDQSTLTVSLTSPRTADAASGTPDGSASARQIAAELHPEYTITVDGTPVDFQLVGTDAVIPRSSLPDVCQVRLIADLGWGKYQTAAVWYNKDYGNELSFGQDYGEYVDCDADGLAQPGDKMVDVLTWAFYRGFLSAINDQNPGNLSYSTAANTQTCTEEITSYAADTFVLNDFQAVAEPGSIRYSDGVVIYNGHFISHRQSRADGSTSDIDHYRTLRLVWEDGCWKVDAFVLFPEGKYDSSSYAPLN